MEPQERPQKKPFSPWPIIGVLSVLIPALVLAVVGYRAESRRQESVAQRLESGTPDVVVGAFLSALSDGRTDVARTAVAESADLDVDDPGYRGLREARVSGADEATDAARATVLARFVTVRPWASGEAPGPQERRVTLERRGGRWLIVRIAAAD